MHGKEKITLWSLSLYGCSQNMTVAKNRSFGGGFLLHMHERLLLHHCAAPLLAHGKPETDNADND